MTPSSAVLGVVLSLIVWGTVIKAHDPTDHCGLSSDGRGGCPGNTVCKNLESHASCYCPLYEVYRHSDPDRCAPGVNACPVNSTCCNNSPFSFECHCRVGYTGRGDILGNCSDINECAINTMLCGSNASCTNVDGSYMCICNRGFVRNGTVCVPGRDECADGSHQCHLNATCLNMDNGYNCVCKNGYTGPGTTCQDINECLHNLSLCSGQHENCTNTDGSYRCDCAAGYTRREGMCVDALMLASSATTSVLMSATTANVQPPISSTTIPPATSTHTFTMITATTVVMTAQTPMALSPQSRWPSHPNVSPVYPSMPTQSHGTMPEPAGPSTQASRHDAQNRKSSSDDSDTIVIILGSVLPTITVISILVAVYYRLKLSSLTQVKPSPAGSPGDTSYASNTIAISNPLIEEETEINLETEKTMDGDDNASLQVTSTDPEMV